MSHVLLGAFPLVGLELFSDFIAIYIYIYTECEIDRLVRERERKREREREREIVFISHDLVCLFFKSD